MLTRPTPGVYAIDRSSRVRSGTLDVTSILPPRCSRNVRSLTLWTSTSSISRTHSTRRSECVASAALHVTSTTSRSWLESATSIAVTIPPSRAIAVATLPTTPWSGAVCSRMVIEYDEAVADMPPPCPGSSVTSK